jgi:hypothetical protein
MLFLDEMVVQFGGRSKHTYRLKGKPTPMGYKSFALCDAGYTYSFLPESRISQAKEVPTLGAVDDKRLSMTDRKVIHLVEQLPFDTRLRRVHG